MPTALVVTAHPDDAEFQAGATIAAWADDGFEVVYCVITDGDAGGADPEVPREERARIRRAEQRTAAKVLGVTEVRFLGYADGRLEAGLDLRRDISRAIREVRPDRVLMQSPEINWRWLPDTHPDHRAAGEATLAAVYPDARNPFAHPEIDVAPWTVPEVWVMAGPHSDHYLDVTATVERKILALREHASQTAHVAGIEDRVRGQLLERARLGGLPVGRSAEAFQRLRTA
jgi:LmbE family N-acetylglucosaminyl deacetylase